MSGKPSGVELWLLTLHGYCLDAPLVAIVWSWNLMRLAQWPMHFSDLLLLMMTIWLGYIVDRGLDILRYPRKDQLPFRHELIRRQVYPLMVLGSLALMFSVFLLSINPHNDLLYYGSMSGALAVMYSLAIYVAPNLMRKIIPRELAVSVFFTLATVILPVSRHLQEIDYHLLFGFVMILLLTCWQNLCAISCWEAKLDEMQEEWSIIHIVNSEGWLSEVNLIVGTLSCLLILCIEQHLSGLTVIAIVIQLGTYALTKINWNPELRSSIADLGMLLPAMLIFFEVFPRS